jgi:hypothetical protein
MIEKLRATLADAAMCASMNFVQTRHGLTATSRAEMESYVEACARISPAQYYDPGEAEFPRVINHQDGSSYCWDSPVTTKYPTNNVARIDLFPCRDGWKRPTVLMLHALMSTSDTGYKRWAARFNELGWNAVFFHLPYHYSRVPPGHWNGELAITSDLVRNAEGLRQSVMEVRQVMRNLKRAGCSEFGLLGTSYGAWVAALTCAVEPELRFAALMAPIVNVEHAIWRCPASITMRRQLKKAGIEQELVARHFHLSSALHMDPMTSPDRILLVAGEYDLVAPADDIGALHRRWSGSELLTIPQGHFGYRMMRETVERLKQQFL